MIKNKKKEFSLTGNRTPGLPDPKHFLKAADVNHYTIKD